jgi:hypothetical protein
VEDPEARDVFRRVVHLAEHVVWCVCFTTALSILCSTAAEDFPAKDRALIGLAIAVGSTFILAALSVARAWRDDGSRLALVFVPVRLVIGVPVLTFLTVAAAAGFAA